MGVHGEENEDTSELGRAGMGRVAWMRAILIWTRRGWRNLDEGEAVLGEVSMSRREKMRGIDGGQCGGGVGRS